MERKPATRAEAQARGLPTYFTGKPCKHDHIAERRADDSQMCVKCTNAATRKLSEKRNREQENQLKALQCKYDNIITRTEAKKLRLMHYFTGKPCKRGHVARRFTSSAHCFVCLVELKNRNYKPLAERRAITSAPMRRCKICRCEKPNTREYFNHHWKGILRTECKDCQHKRLEEARRNAGIPPKVEINFASNTRKCKKCHREFSNTAEFFRCDKSASILNECLDCLRKRCRRMGQQRREQKPGYVPRTDRIAARRAPTKACTDCGEEKPNTKEFFFFDASSMGGQKGLTEAQCLKCRTRNKTKYEMERLKRDPVYKLRHAISTRLKFGFKMFGKTKVNRTLDIVGYTTKELFKHLEKRFLPGMTWKNHGEWHIDHIRPLASFNSTDYSSMNAMIREAFALPNLQPLWGPDNFKKASVWHGKRWYLGRANKAQERYLNA